jgi:hypothetical protein
MGDVAIATWPGAWCNVHPPNLADIDNTIPVVADPWGAARFRAVIAQPGDPVTSLEADCQDAAGAAATYAIDLTATATFAPVPRPVTAPPNAILRPALQGDPTTYSVEELLDGHYGMRPDPLGAPTLYAAWLKGATTPTWVLKGSGRPMPISGASTITDNPPPGWSGLMWTDATFDLVEWTLTVPNASACSGSGCCTAAYLWGGMGGWGNASLIQDGVQVKTTSAGASTAATYEFWSGNGVGGSCYSGECAAFNVSSGDSVFGAAWACNSNGTLNVNGGYGCYELDDNTSNVSVDCTSSTGTCPSLAQINTFSGSEGEIIIEDNAPNNACGSSGTFFDFETQTIDVLAYDTTGAYHDPGNDTNVNTFDLQNTSGQALAATGPDNDYAEGATFSWEQGS